MTQTGTSLGNHTILCVVFFFPEGHLFALGSRCCLCLESLMLHARARTHTHTHTHTHGHTCIVCESVSHAHTYSVSLCESLWRCIQVHKHARTRTRYDIISVCTCTSTLIIQFCGILIPEGSESWNTLPHVNEQKVYIETSWVWSLQGCYTEYFTSLRRNGITVRSVL